VGEGGVLFFLEVEVEGGREGIVGVAGVDLDFVGSYY